MAKALIFGGSGQLGFAVAEELLGDGWACQIVTRGERQISPALVKNGAIAVDGADRRRQQIVEDTGTTFDLVFDPTAYTPDDAADLLSAGAKIGSIVSVSSASVYADAEGRTLDEARDTGFPVFDGAISEDCPTVPPGPQTYSTLKVAMENVLLDGQVPVSILRPCAIYGLLTRHPREWWFVKRALDGRRPIPIAHDGQSRFHTSSAQGIAGLVRWCANAPDYRILNVADPQAPTVSQIASAIGTAIDYEFDLLPFPGGGSAPDYAGHSPWSVERPFCLNTEKAMALGWDGGPRYAVAVEPVCRWLVDIAGRSDWRAQFTGLLVYGRDIFDYAAEDRLIADLSSREGG